MLGPFVIVAVPLLLAAGEPAGDAPTDAPAPAPTGAGAPAPPPGTAPSPPPPGTAPTPPAQPPPGYAPQGYPPPGYAPQGYPPPGYAPQGYPPPGYAPQGYPPPGYAPQAYPSSSYAPQAQLLPGHSPPTPPPPAPPPSWLLRLALEFGSAASSDHKDLLEKEGYGLGLVWFEATGAYLFNEHVGAGVWLATSGGSSTPENGGPELEYESWYAGVEVPISFGSRTVRMLIAPRFGYAWGQLALAGKGDTQSGLAYGAQLGVMFPQVHLGVALGWVRAPVKPPGELGRDYDLGATTFGIMGVIDG